MQEQVSFFEETREESNNKVQEVIDLITQKYGRDSIVPASYKEDNRKIQEKLKE